MEVEKGRRRTLVGNLTVQTLRTPRQWLQITRDPSRRTFTLARGYAGEVLAHARETWSFVSVPHWDDAVELAVQQLKDWE